MAIEQLISADTAWAASVDMLYAMLLSNSRQKVMQSSEHTAGDRVLVVCALPTRITELPCPTLLLQDATYQRTPCWCIPADDEGDCAVQSTHTPTCQLLLVPWQRL